MLPSTFQYILYSQVLSKYFPVCLCFSLSIFCVKWGVGLWSYVYMYVCVCVCLCMCVCVCMCVRMVQRGVCGVTGEPAESCGRRVSSLKDSSVLLTTEW